MKRIVGGVLVLVLALPALWARDDSKAKPAKPAEQYQALVKEFNDAQQAFFKTYQKAKTEEEKSTLLEEKYPGDTMAPKFLEFAEKNAKDPAGVDALLWVAQNARKEGKDSPRARALAVLSHDHVTKPKVTALCQRMVFDNDPASGDFLRAVLEKSSEKKVQGQACVVLALHLQNRLNGLSGKDLDAARKEIEDTLERAAKEFNDVQVQGFGQVGQRAKKELADFRHLSVGKEAPSLEGTDQDGKKFKLSEYHGKVVLLDFWGNW
jgi:hypothetical protein